MNNTETVSDQTQETVSQETNDQEESPNQETREKVVSWDNHRRALNDMHKFKSRTKELEERLSEAEHREREMEEQRLREQEDWKSLAEKRKEEADKWKSEAETRAKQFYDTQKYNALKTAALKEGILPEAIDDLDRLISLDEVEIETTESGRYVVMNAEEVISNFKESRPFLFQRDGAPRINGGGGGTPPVGESITKEHCLKADRDLKAGLISKEKHQEIYRKYLIQTGRIPKGG